MQLQLTRLEVEAYLKHPSPEIQELAQCWIEKHDEVKNRLQDRKNVIGAASALLTLDSQLVYQLEEEEEINDFGSN